MSSNSHRSALLDTWTQTSSHMFNSVVAANKAAFAAFGVPAGEEETENAAESTAESVAESTAETEGTAEGVAETESAALPSRDRLEADEDLVEWTVDVSAADRSELGVGDRVEFTKTISEEDVQSFAAASGDTNPLHLDDEYASETRFRGRIAHGTLVGGLISAALARLPGLVVYLSQDLEFHNPVRIGDRPTAECEIVEDLGNEQYRLTTTIYVGDDTVIDGEAVVLIDDKPE